MVWLALGAVALIGAAAWGPMASNVEQARYTVVESHGAIEIRDYAPMLIARTEVTGPREEAISQGFRIVADYIFGNNTTAEQVAMTAPVMQQPSETSKKIAMTAPVMQQAQSEGRWNVAFVMPASYTLKTLPTPKNGAVTITSLPAKRVAAIQFSGSSSHENIATHEQALMAFLEAQKLTQRAEPTYAFFNPPWTLPFLRRNEVMVEINP